MPTKREHIYQRKDGRWEGRYRSGIDKEGKAVYRSVYGKSYGEVKKKLSECKEKDAAVKLPSGNSLLFRDVVFLWQKTNVNRYKGATALKYENLINNHIIPVLGGYKLAEFNTFLLTDFMTEKLTNGRVDRSGGLSASYVRSIMLVVLEIIDFAAAENLCAVPKTKLRKPAPEKKEIEILDANSQRLLEKQLTQHPDETAVGILLSLNTGLRIGEVCALRWSDIDLEKAILRVRSTVARVKSSDNGKSTELIIDKPKTKTSLRDIPVPKRLMDILVSLYEKRKSEYVISDKEGFVSPRTYEYRFHRMLEKYHIRSVNYHALRHTFATRCIEHGVDVKTLSEILGHSNVAITLNTYVHSSIDRKREQLEKLTMYSA